MNIFFEKVSLVSFILLTILLHTCPILAKEKLPQYVIQFSMRLQEDIKQANSLADRYNESSYILSFVLEKDHFSKSINIYSSIKENKKIHNMVLDSVNIALEAAKKLHTGLSSDIQGFKEDIKGREQFEQELNDGFELLNKATEKIGQFLNNPEEIRKAYKQSKQITKKDIYESSIIIGFFIAIILIAIIILITFHSLLFAVQYNAFHTSRASRIDWLKKEAFRAQRFYDANQYANGSKYARKTLKIAKKLLGESNPYYHELKECEPKIKKKVNLEGAATFKQALSIIEAGLGEGLSLTITQEMKDRSPASGIQAPLDEECCTICGAPLIGGKKIMGKDICSECHSKRCFICGKKGKDNIKLGSLLVFVSTCKKHHKLSCIAGMIVSILALAGFIFLKISSPERSSDHSLIVFIVAFVLLFGDLMFSLLKRK